MRKKSEEKHRTSIEELPEAAQGEIPEAAQEEIPEAAQEEIPETAQEEISEAAQREIPETALEETGEVPEKNGRRKAARHIRFCAGFAVLFAAGLLTFVILCGRAESGTDGETEEKNAALPETAAETDFSGAEGGKEGETVTEDRLTENSGRAASGVPETDAKENSGVTGENGAEASAGPQTADESLPVSVGAEEPGSAAGAPSGGTENGGGQPAAAEENAEQPLSAEHVHRWEPQYATVYHEAETQQVWVVDQAAWEEPVYEEQPVYETYGVNICNICGAELLTSEEISRHGEQYVDWETMSSPFSYHYEERKRQTGTETVQTGTIRHEEKGHYEARVISPAWEEQVQSGFRCAVCGASG